MKIIVVGGGIGGLSLAAGLKKNGFEVVVLERDSDLSVTGGYHITLRKNVQDALLKLLPKSNFDKILASSADCKKRDADVFWDWRGRLFGVMKKLKDPGIDIDRISLRILLGEAVSEMIMLGRSCIGYEIKDDKVVAKLEDGSLLSGDLLIGCDGTQSTIVKQLIGHTTNVPTGIVGISGRTPTINLNSNLRKKLGTRSSMAMGPGGVALYLGYFDPINHAVMNKPEIRASTTKEATFIWGAMFPESKYTLELKDKKGSDLQTATINNLKKRNWSSELLEVIAKSPTDDIAIYRFNAASSKAEEIAPWKPSRVIALGDAVHSTPPTAGMGAGIAVLDAEDLVNELIKVRDSKKNLNLALGEFDERMRLRGSEAIVAALAVIKWIKFTDTFIGSILTKIFLPLMVFYSKVTGNR